MVYEYGYRDYKGLCKGSQNIEYMKIWKYNLIFSMHTINYI